MKAVYSEQISYSLKIKQAFSDNQKQNADNEMRPQIVTYAFRQVFHDSAVLYLDGK